MARIKNRRRIFKPLEAPGVKQKPNPWGLRKQKSKAGLFIKFVLEVEKLLPGASGPEKKQWVVARIDDLIKLPPIAEEISDFIIAIGAEIAYASVQATKSKFEVISKEELAALKSNIDGLIGANEKLKADYRNLYAQWRKLKEAS